MTWKKLPHGFITCFLERNNNMGSFILADNRFVYEQQGRTQLLLDMNDFLSNKSRISFHRYPGQEHPILSDLLLRLLEKAKSGEEEMTLPVIMTDTLLAARLIRSSQPFRVLEYGCQDGQFSSHIAELLGTFHGESTLVCAYNTLDFTSMDWMERMADVTPLPKLSYFAGDYGSLQLPRHDFDIVFLNGAVPYTHPREILLDALGLLKEDGTLFCYTDNAPLLESTFKLFFEKREEYELSPLRKILLAKAEDRIWETGQAPDFAAQARQHLDWVKDILKDILTEKQQDRDEIDRLVNLLAEDCRHAAAAGNVALKQELLEQKERLVSYRVQSGLV